MPTPIRFVLVHPRTPENLGAAARALKNFGQKDWTWVRPPWNPDDPRARTLAVGATVLQNIYPPRPLVYDDLMKRQPIEVLGGTIYLYRLPLKE